MKALMLVYPDMNVYILIKKIMSPEEGEQDGIRSYLRCELR
jgi:hypothetical protein